MNSKIFALVLFTLISFSFISSEKSVKDSLIGTWSWQNMIDLETEDEMGMDMLTMGKDIEIKTEFKKDNSYIEYKSKLEGEGFSEKKGKWKLENNNQTLSLQSEGKDKWVPSRIVSISEDKLILEMRPNIGLLLIKE